mmetsp:Transcript_25182/g.28001  ORF Transcript_25182/g.28001 Transcript_25182/m.28001 type:complete len:217 (+) Transcript_25182:67-717(+)
MDALILDGVEHKRGIVYGSTAKVISKKSGDATHSWRAYVRGVVEDQDISYFIKKVHFHIHESFANPLRIVKKPPFQVTEKGWGEFMIKIELFFVDESISPVTFQHDLKLLPPPQRKKRKKSDPVISETYRVISFIDPSRKLHNIMLKHPQSEIAPVVYDWENGLAQASTVEEEKEILEAQKTVINEIMRLRTLYDKAVNDSKMLKKDIQKLQARVF